MSVKTAKNIRIILMVIACVAVISGITNSQKAAKEAATDVSKINVQITNMNCYHKQNDGAYTYGRYYIDFTFKITNNTKVDWGYLKVTTYVYDKSGKALCTIKSEFGQSYGSSDLKLKVGETVTTDSSIAENAYNPGDSFMRMYESNLSDLRFESEVTYGSYYK